MPARRVTIEDVARVAHVSAATVSRALQGNPVISPRTQALVVHAAHRLGYVPNQAARSLVVRSTRTLGLLIPDATDPIHGQVAAGFEQEAGAHGYSVILASGFGEATREQRALRLFTVHRADGIALMGSVLRQRDVRAAARPGHVVFINSEHPGLSGYQGDLPAGCIRADDVSGIEAVVTHLVERGYRRIGYAGGRATASNITRRDAALRALREMGVGTLRQYAGPDNWQAGGAVASEIAHDRPDAVICYDDKLALHTMDALRALGIRVPRDIAIVGFDDIPFARISNPRLTTVAQPSAEMGRRAAAILLRAIETGEMPRSVMLPVQLMVRESSVRSTRRART